MPKISQIIRFAENTINEAPNTYTDQQLIESVGEDTFLGKLLRDGIAYGSVAESDILNAILRQTTFTSALLAEFIKTRYSGPDITINSSMSIANALTALEDSLMTLVSTVRPLINTLNETTPGKALDATQGKVLSDMITNETNRATNAENAISNNVSNLANLTANSMNAMNNSVANITSNLANNIANLGTTKLDKVNQTNVAFVTNGTNQPSYIPYSQGIIHNGFMMTTSTGQAVMNDPISNNHGVTLGYLNNMINNSVKVLFEDHSSTNPVSIFPGPSGKITITVINAANLANVTNANKANRLFISI